MGYVKHHAIIVTGWETGRVEAAHRKARSLGMQVSAILHSEVNDYGTFLIAPDGSKEGWEDSDAGDRQRADFIAYMQQPEERNSLEWCVVEYGKDDDGASVRWRPKHA